MARGRRADHALNVTLRETRPDDADWLRSWFEQRADALRYERRVDELVAPTAAIRSRVIVRDGHDAGVLVAATGRRRQEAVIEIVTTAPAEARRGTGMTAAALVEDELRSDGVRRLFGPAPQHHGISVYFWIRLGYRPLLRAEWPCESDGVAWLRRDLD